jgi:hypothetical protein
MMRQASEGIVRRTRAWHNVMLLDACSGCVIVIVQELLQGGERVMSNDAMLALETGSADRMEQ